MGNKGLIFEETFRNLREKPKIWRLLIISLALIIITSLPMLFTNNDLPDDEKYFAIVALIILLSISIPITMAFIFAITLAVARIMNSTVSKRAIFAGNLLTSIITSIPKMIGLIILAIMGLDIEEISLTSLNVFSPGNPWLSLIDLQFVLGFYVVFIFFYATCKFTKKSAMAWSAAATVMSMLSIFFGHLATF